MSDKAKPITLEDLEKTLEGLHAILDDEPYYIAETQDHIWKAASKQREALVLSEWKSGQRTQRHSAERLQRYQAQLDRIVAQLPEMGRYADLWERQQADDLGEEDSKELISIRASSPAAFQVHERLEALVEIRQVCQRLQELRQRFLDRLWVIAENNGITLPVEPGRETESDTSAPENWREKEAVSQGAAAEIIGVKHTRSVRYHVKNGNLKKVSSGKITTASLDKYLKGNTPE